MKNEESKIPVDVGDELRELYHIQKQRALTGVAKEAETSIITSDTTKNVEVCANLLKQIDEVQNNMGTAKAIESKDARVNNILKKYT